MTLDLEEESYICYAYWVPYEVYIKDFSKFLCLGKTTNEVHILNVHVKTELLMYDKGGFFTFEFLTPEGGLQTIRKTELEEDNGILKNPLYTLLKGT